MGNWPYPRSRGIALSATFAALISVASPVSIPLGPITQVPITLQVFFVYLAGALLGARYGALSMVIYLVLGAVGLPVFAGPSFGTAVLLGYTCSRFPSPACSRAMWPVGVRLRERTT